jgi:hypothetical protein
VVIAKGCATSEPTSWTASPVVPVMSTARIDPPSARHVPTFTRTGAADPDVAFTRAVPAKDGEPPTVASPSDPVLKMASSTEDVSGGTDVGAVTPGNPVTPVHVPAGSETTLPRKGAAADADAGLVAALDEAALVGPAPCDDVVAGSALVAVEAAVPVAEVAELEAGVLSLGAPRAELDADGLNGARKR